MKSRRGVNLKSIQPLLVLGFGILLFTLLILDDRTHWRKKDGEKHTSNGQRVANINGEILYTTLPDTWKLTTDLSSKLQLRREHVKNVCHERKLDIRNGTYQPNAWEFIVSDKHRLSWCNIFKAASSTWLYNFNILAGYTEKALLKARDTPISMARKKYPRINVDRLDEIMNNGSYLSFMIARHPFDRLASGYRNKVENNSIFYEAMKSQNLVKYADIPGPKFDIKDPRSKGQKAHVQAPSFPQFVQYLIDSHLQGDVLDMHFIPMSTFCTPCLVNFDVYAKVETLNEDGNYIIFTSGIEKIIHPKIINRSKKGPTEDVTKKYLCTLSDVQKKGLINLYQLDLELFEYDYKKYFDCDIDSI